MLDRRISLFLNLPLGALDNLAIKKKIDEIGRQRNSACLPAH